MKALTLAARQAALTGGPLDVLMTWHLPVGDPLAFIDWTGSTELGGEGNPLWDLGRENLAESPPSFSAALLWTMLASSIGSVGPFLVSIYVDVMR